jgi:hypothetical protein
LGKICAVQRLEIHVRCCLRKHDSAALHHIDVVGDRHRTLRVLLDQYDGPAFGLEARQQCEDPGVSSIARCTMPTVSSLTRPGHRIAT